jgi:cyclopropane-fatty-acyl-phospholipid synthase
MSSKAIFLKLAKKAGIEVNGSNVWDIKVHNEKLYDRVLQEQSLGLGEAYMDGWWDCERIDLMLEKVIRANVESELKLSLREKCRILWSRIWNRQRGRGAHSGIQHYNTGNDLYSHMLDKTMTYSCAYWQSGAQTLEEAQIKKLDLVCRKLNLKPGMKLLDLGCGWGALMKYACENYGVTAVGYQLADEQIEFGRKFVGNLPITFVRDNYLNAAKRINETGTFDALAMVGSIEHCGVRNLRSLLEGMHKLLREDGIILIHMIANNSSLYTCDPFFDKYLFPNAVDLSPAQLSTAAEGLFVLEDVHNFGPDYHTTLLAWYDNFQAAWPVLSGNYTERFKRMWEYYLLSVGGVFKARQLQLLQFVYTKIGRKQPHCRFS